MKRFLLLLTAALLCFSPLTVLAQNRISQSKISSLVSRYKRQPGFEVVKLGMISTLAIKKMIRVAAQNDPDPDTQALLKTVNGIKKITVIDFEDCSARDEIRDRIDGIVSGADLLMEVKDSGEAMSMYGVVSEDGRKVKDFVLYAPSDYSLICLFGNISMDAIASLAQ